MATAMQLKKDMEFYRSLGTLIETLKLLAAARYQSLEKKMRVYALYLEKLSGMCRWLDMQHVCHPFVRVTDKPACAVCITTDAGMLGGLNSLVMNKALRWLEQENGGMVIIGRRGGAYIEKRNRIYATFPGIIDEQRLAQALKLRDYLVSHVTNGVFGKVAVVYPRPLSFTTQSIEVVPLLPFVPAESGRAAAPGGAAVLFESAPAAVAEYVIYLWLGQKLFEVFGESRLAEQGARYMHLENCTQRLREQDRTLRFQYFRAKHEIVDQNMRELFAARILHAQ
ncbi:MAG: F0F1 ATP synthase subunit gamma [Candidatus Omnitrophica bacterium]|nr:F0F1 ATP synthase subunit gamma [Candidatus Omnitrophota bacterium]